MVDGMVPGAKLVRLTFDGLIGFGDDSPLESWRSFLLSCEAMVSNIPHQRRGVPYSDAQCKIAQKALKLGSELPNDQIKLFYRDHFVPYLIVPDDVQDQGNPAFFTAYYRPEADASSVQSDIFSEPLFARPADLVTLEQGEDIGELCGLTSARRQADGRLNPYPTRAEIDSGALGELAHPIAFVADGIEAFMIHVQGSARLRFSDGQKIDLSYAARNGRPYTSIGKILIADGAMSLKDMSLASLKTWVRENGQTIGQKGRSLLHRNESFIFFDTLPVEDDALEPVAAANVRLTAGRSLAIDRHLWAYGLPFWIEVDLPWHDRQMNRFNRLMIAQDTGSAIVGPARADLYFGTGDDAGSLAGNVRHHGRMVVFLPKSVDQ